MPESEIKDQKVDIMVQRSLRRNVTAALIDSGSFGGALGFIGYSTVLPTIAQALSHSEPFVGLITTIWSGMWLLPQLPAGRWMAGRVYKKPILLRTAFFSRIGLLIFAVLLALNLNPTLLLILLPIVVATFRGLDGVAAVAWFDIISKMFPPHVRGKILGWTQSAAFSTQFLSAFVVAWALSEAGPVYPYNYALLMGLAGIFVMISWSALLFYVEPPGDVSNNVSAQLSIGAHARHILKSDRSFRLNAICRILIGGIGFATPFYVLQATQILQVPTDTIGLFLAAQTVGGVASSLICGVISQRRGSHIVIRITLILALIPPLMALLLNFFARGNAALATAGMVVIFAAMGATDGSFLLGFLQHVLDIAPPAERTAYTGLSNTIGGLTVIAPTIGGLLLQATSFQALFVVTLVFPIAGLIVASRMPRVRRELI
jgi:MFS family permease